MSAGRFPSPLISGFFLASLLSLGAATACADSLPPPVKQALQQADLPASALSVWVQDTQGKRPLLAIGAERAVNPASTMKLVTTYAALELLGPAYVWKTEAYAAGPVKAGVLDGDLVLKGYGDPKLTLENFWLLLRELRQRRVQEIRGDLVLDQGYFAPLPHDPGAFDKEPLRAYNTGPQALLVNFNAIRLRLLPQQDGTVNVVADPAPAGLRVINNVAADPGACGDWRERITTDVIQNGSEFSLTVGGSFALSCGDRNTHLSLLRNGRYAFELFRQLWAELGGRFNGVLKSGETPAGARLLAERESPPLADVIRDINKFSNNVMARQLFLTLGAERFGPPASPEKGGAAVAGWLAAKGLDFPELVLENGSGLSRTERISPAHLGELLVSANNSPVFSEFESSLPIVAVDGTMKKRLNDHAVAGHAHIKTGSLEGVRSLAGYVFDARGRRMAVVAIVNHPRAGAARPALDALLQWVYQRP